MTIEEAIKHAERVAQANKSANCTERAEEHTQIAEWLTELKQLRADCEKQKDINREWVDDYQKLLSETKELKKLLKLAVEDMKNVSDGNCCYHCVYGDPITRRCNNYNINNANCYKWQHAEKALKLIGGEENA